MHAASDLTERHNLIKLDAQLFKPVLRFYRPKEVKRIGLGDFGSDIYYLMLVLPHPFAR